MGRLYTLENDSIRIRVSSCGAELESVIKKDSGREYMWYCDDRYWGRVSPVLFPLVGNYRDHRMKHDGKVYESSQHGFARDMDFALASQMDDELWFVLNETEETLRHYPFRFSLVIGYRINGSSVRIMWNVMNHDKGDIFFSIGGHPGFLSPVDGAHIEFDVHGSLTAGVLDENGLLTDRTKELKLEGGRLALSHKMFEEDALIFEDQQIKRALLTDENGDKVVEVLFDSPLLGLWTQKGMEAPFICIEPWYGRTDRDSFEGELRDREWGNRLKPSEVFSAHYDLIFF